MSTVGPVDKGSIQNRLKRIQTRVEDEIQNETVSEAAAMVRRQNLKGLGELEGTPEHDVLKRVKNMMYNHQTSTLLVQTTEGLLAGLEKCSEHTIAVDKATDIKTHAQASIQLGEASRQGADELLEKHVSDYKASEDISDEKRIEILSDLEAKLDEREDLTAAEKEKLQSKIDKNKAYLEEMIFFNGLDPIERICYNLIRTESALEKSIADIKSGMEVYSEFEDNIDKFQAEIEEEDFGFEDEEDLDLGVNLRKAYDAGPSVPKSESDDEDWDLDSDVDEPAPQGLTLGEHEAVSEPDWDASEDEDITPPEEAVSPLQLATREAQESDLDWGSDEASESEVDLRESVGRSLSLGQSFDAQVLSDSIEQIKSLQSAPQLRPAASAPISQSEPAKLQKGKTLDEMRRNVRHGPQHKSSTLRRESPDKDSPSKAKKPKKPKKK